MGEFKNKVDFVALVSVTNANSNGDPLNGNRPRIDYDGYGEISDVCIKRKIRNRMQDLGNKVFVMMEERANDGKKTLRERGAEVEKISKKDGEEKAAEFACKEWIDVRTFGQIFAFGKKDDEKKGLSIGIRGPVSIHQAVSVSPIDINSMQITKSVKGDKNENKKQDTMGMKHFVRFGLYKIKGSINVQLAEKTGFSEEDACVLKECLRTLFVNDASSARPDGSMEVIKVYWWQHNCKDGQVSSAKIHRSVKAVPKDGVITPVCVDDYNIEVDMTELNGFAPEEMEGI